MNMPFHIRRLRASDAPIFREIRLESLSNHPSEFSVDLSEEVNWTLDQHAERLEKDFILGGFEGEMLLGIAGLARFEGLRLQHKAYLYGMYIKSIARGSGLANNLLDELLKHAETQVEQVVLSLVAQSKRAKQLYERYGFILYGIEPRAMHIGDDYIDTIWMIKLFK